MGGLRAQYFQNLGACPPNCDFLDPSLGPILKSWVGRDPRLHIFGNQKRLKFWKNEGFRGNFALFIEFKGENWPNLDQHGNLVVLQMQK